MSITNPANSPIKQGDLVKIEIGLFSSHSLKKGTLAIVLDVYVVVWAPLIVDVLVMSAQGKTEQMAQHRLSKIEIL